MIRPAETSTPRPYGFTLVEMLVSSVVMSLVLGGVMATVLAFHGSFQAEAVTKTATEGSRATLSFLDRVVSRTGYGLDPLYGVDFTTTGIPGTIKDNYAATTAAPGNVPYVTDDLALRFRDSNFSRRAYLNASASTITLDAITPTVGTTFGVGQNFLVACSSPSEYVPGRPRIEYIVLKSTATVAATNTTIAVSQVGTPFETFGGAPLRTLPTCLTSVGTDAPVLMVLYAVRLRIVDLQGRPFLVAFHNLNSPDPVSNPDFDPIAADVENFQVAYVMRRPTPGSSCCAAQPAPDAAGNGDWIMGDTGDTTGMIPAFNATTPAYETAYDDSTRYSGLAANVQGFRLTFSIRSRSNVPNKRSLSYPTFSPVENYTGASVADGHYRLLTSTTIRAPNMSSRSFFLPPLTAANLAALNVGGG